MAPKRRRSKVGLGRMDAALDAMRFMGFPADAVRKSVRKLLKVYGDEGWVFIEDGAYQLLIDTIVEEDQLEHETGLPPLESCSKGSDELPASGNKRCDKEATYGEHEEPFPPLESCSKGSRKQPASGKQLCDKEATYDEHEKPPFPLQIQGSEKYCQDVKLGREKMEGQELAFEDVKDHKEVEEEVDLTPAYDPQPLSRVPVGGRCRPCYGWISDDEGDDTVEPEFGTLYASSKLRKNAVEFDG